MITSKSVRHWLLFFKPIPQLLFCSLILLVWTKRLFSPINHFLHLQQNFYTVFFHLQFQSVYFYSFFAVLLLLSTLWFFPLLFSLCSFYDLDCYLCIFHAVFFLSHSTVYLDLSGKISSRSFWKTAFNSKRNFSQKGSKNVFIKKLFHYCKIP